MLPNMAQTIRNKSIPFTYVVVTKSGNDFNAIITKVEKEIRGVIQIPQDEVIQASILDISMNYRQVHITTEWDFIPKNDDEIKYKNKIYKLVRFRNYAEYGYYEFICEEVLNGSY